MFDLVLKICCLSNRYIDCSKERKGYRRALCILTIVYLLTHPLYYRPLGSMVLQLTWPNAQRKPMKRRGNHTPNEAEVFAHIDMKTGFGKHLAQRGKVGGM